MKHSLFLELVDADHLVVHIFQANTLSGGFVSQRRSRWYYEIFNCNISKVCYVRGNIIFLLNDDCLFVLVAFMND